MADFVAVPFGTVNHEHGERRQIQRLTNNLKSSSGIERIPFNGIDELDTEQGPAGQVVYALNTGDSRIRFINGTQNWRPFTSTNSTGTQPGTAIQVGPITNTSTEIMGSIEITFFGTNLNLLSAIDTISNNWMASIDGGAFAQVSPNFNSAAQWYTPEQFDEDLNRKIKPNNVTPIASFTTPGVHTVLIRFQNHGRDPATFGQAAGILFGCEIVNANTGITQQPGADFDGRVSALGGTTFPIKPLNTTIPSVNSRSGVLEALPMTATTGARVLNYITSGGQFKQSFDVADEAPVVQVAGEQSYIIEIQNGGSSSVTLPISATSFTLTAFAGGGGGGGSGGATNSFGTAGAGGGGGSKSGATFTRGASTQAETLALVISGTAAGSFNLLSGSGTAGGVTTVTTGGTAIAATSGGGGGQSGGVLSAASGGAGGSIGVSQTFTGWTITSQTDAAGSDGGNGQGQNAESGPGGNVGGFGIAPLTGIEGMGGASEGTAVPVNRVGDPGDTPGGGGGGVSTTPSAGFGNTGGSGAAGRIYLVITASSGLNNTSFGVATGEFTAGAASGGVLGAPTATFGNALFDANRLNQQVIRRINFREFGANSAFADASGNSQNDAFTLDDGTTTLVGNNIDYIGIARGTQDDTAGATNQPFVMNQNNTGDFVTLTFVGTGLDVFAERSVNITDFGISVSVDGFSVGPMPDPGLGFRGIIPIVSGLAYGTHTVQIITTATTGRFGVLDFILYGPKKPEIPTLDAGSLELSDYNIMADYAATVNTTPGNGLGKGVLRKPGVREILYQGAQASYTPSIDTNSLSGVDIDTLNGNNWIRYTFYGTGFDFRFQANTAATASQRRRLRIYIDQGFDPAGAAATPLALDGTDTIDGNTIGVAFYGTGTTAATLVNAAAANADNQNPSTTAVTNGELRINSTTDNNAGLVITNLPLGLHSVKIFQAATVSGNRYAPRAFDVITPIHINEDSLKVGSEGLNNLTIDPVVEEDEAVIQAKLGEAKAWVRYNKDGNIVQSSFNVSAIIEDGNTVYIYFDKPFKDNFYVGLATVNTTSSTPISVQTDSPGEARVVYTENGPFHAAFFGELIDE